VFVGGEKYTRNVKTKFSLNRSRDYRKRAQGEKLSWGKKEKKQLPGPPGKKERLPNGTEKVFVGESRKGRGGGGQDKETRARVGKMGEENARGNKRSHKLEKLKGRGAATRWERKHKKKHGICLKQEMLKGRGKLGLFRKQAFSLMALP